MRTGARIIIPRRRIYSSDNILKGIGHWQKKLGMIRNEKFGVPFGQVRISYRGTIILPIYNRKGKFFLLLLKIEEPLWFSKESLPANSFRYRSSSSIYKYSSSNFRQCPPELLVNVVNFNREDTRNISIRQHKVG